MRLSIQIFLFLCLGVNLQAQSSSSSVSFIPTVNNEALKLNVYYPAENGQDSFSINKLRFYISNIAFYNDDKLIHALSQTHILLDISDPASLTINYDQIPAHNTIKFQMGIDSTTNASGAKGGDLDPMHGMYWTWNSGYINFKIEGTASNSTERKNRFRYHIGGYQNGFNALRKIELPVVLTEELNIDIPIDQFLNPILNAKAHTIMSPSARSMKCADMLAKIITIKE